MASLHEYLLGKQLEGYKMKFEEINNTLVKFGDDLEGTGLNSAAFKEFLVLAGTLGLGVDSASNITAELHGASVSNEKLMETLRECWDISERKFLFNKCAAVRKAAEKKAKEDEAENEKDILEAWRKAEWANIEQTVSSLMSTISSLYKSGVESMAQPGILLNNGEDSSPLVVVKYNEAVEGKPDFCGIENKVDSGLMTDLMIMETLATALPNLTAMQGIDPTTGFPTLAALHSNEGVMFKAHLMFQSVSIPFSGADNNKNSIKKWIRDTKGISGEQWINDENRRNKKRINRYEDAKDWYKWVLENTLYRYFIEAGLKPDVYNASAIKTVRLICDTFAKKFRNVVVVAERESRGKTLQSTELRVCTDTEYDTVLLADRIASALNTGNAKDITAAPRATENQVTAIRIVYDKKAANSAVVFASQIAQGLIDGGNTPKWNKVLLGRKQNGEFLFWEDFMYGKEAADRAYAIYAGSGAGKGIMTLTLMAAAISDNRQLFYTDGKPDSGASIGALAWRDGKEMYMFDGQAQGGAAFPGYLEANAVTNGVRDPQETLSYVSAIPKGLFSNEAQVREFLGVCRYLRSLDLCAKVLIARDNGTLPMKPNPEDDFQIWVFDEMTSMSGHEKNVRKAFASYIKNKGYKFASVKKDDSGQEVLIGIKGGKEYNEVVDSNSDKYDACVAYIADWLNWVAPISSTFANPISVITLRNAQANIFFIFQNAEWISNEKDGSLTTIAAIVQALKCRKFIGANGLAKACGHYGDGNTMRTEWASTIAGGGGWWAVSKSSDIRQEGTEITIFKPYSIWGFRKPGAVGNDENYLDYYCNLILGDRVSASDVLQSAWDYAEQAVLTLSNEDNRIFNPATSLKDYMYNVKRFSPMGEEYDPSNISNTGEVNNEFSDYSAGFNQNILNPLSGHSEEEQTYSGAETSSGNRDDDIFDMMDNTELSMAPDDEEDDAGVEVSFYDTEGTEYAEYRPGNTSTDYADEDEFSFEDFGDEAEGVENTPLGTTEDYDYDEAEEFSVDDDDLDVPVTPLTGAGAAGDVESHYSSGDYAPTSKRSKEACWSEDGKGAPRIDIEKVGRGTKVQALNTDKNNGNCIKCYGRSYSDSEMYAICNGSDKKYAKFLSKTWTGLLYDIADAVNGRMNVRTLAITQNAIFVGNKIIQHPMFKSSYICLADMVEFSEMLVWFSNLNVLILDTTMWEVLENQITPLITENDVADGVNDGIDYILRHCGKLNTVKVKKDGAKEFIVEKKKADLTDKARKEHIAVVRERAYMKQKQEVESMMAQARKQKGYKQKVKPAKNVRKTKSSAKQLAKGVGGFAWKATKGIGKAGWSLMKGIWKLAG